MTILSWLNKRKDHCSNGAFHDNSEVNEVVQNLNSSNIGDKGQIQTLDR